eukprot:TRINITY_DN12282_c0_g1_i15.p1 TRINITY_DN12282_c0_g1~~TRINITY_DN12282_c0_g1_i15.p1  ORF type:complete len:806 (+),score=78.33 TRINITY_DN12282_c0_g1_i15:1282-3699(+)
MIAVRLICIQLIGLLVESTSPRQLSVLSSFNLSSFNNLRPNLLGVVDGAPLVQADRDLWLGETFPNGTQWNPFLKLTKFNSESVIFARTNGSTVYIGETQSVPLGMMFRLTYIRTDSQGHTTNKTAMLSNLRRLAQCGFNSNGLAVCASVEFLQSTLFVDVLLEADLLETISNYSFAVDIPLSYVNQIYKVSVSPIGHIVLHVQGSNHDYVVSLRRTLQTSWKYVGTRNARDCTSETGGNYAWLTSSMYIEACSAEAAFFTLNSSMQLDNITASTNNSAQARKWLLTSSTVVISYNQETCFQAYRLKDTSWSAGSVVCGVQAEALAQAVDDDESLYLMYDDVIIQISLSDIEQWPTRSTSTMFDVTSTSTNPQVTTIHTATSPNTASRTSSVMISVSTGSTAQSFSSQVTTPSSTSSGSSSSAATNSSTQHSTSRPSTFSTRSPAHTTLSTTSSSTAPSTAAIATSTSPMPTGQTSSASSSSSGNPTTSTSSSAPTDPSMPFTFGNTTALPTNSPIAVPASSQNLLLIIVVSVVAGLFMMGLMSIAYWYARRRIKQHDMLLDMAFDDDGALIVPEDEQDDKTLAMELKDVKQSRTDITLAVSWHEALEMIASDEDAKSLSVSLSKLSDNINLLDSQGRSLLTHAITRMRLEAVKLLLPRVTDSTLCTRDRHGYAPIHWACLVNNLEAVQFMVDFSTKHQNLLLLHTDTGQNLLHLAVRENNVQMLRLVTTMGSQRLLSRLLTTDEHYGETALDLARRLQHLECAVALQEQLDILLADAKSLKALKIKLDARWRRQLVRCTLPLAL